MLRSQQGFFVKCSQQKRKHPHGRFEFLLASGAQMTFLWASFLFDNFLLDNALKSKWLWTVVGTPKPCFGLSFVDTSTMVFGDSLLLIHSPSIWLQNSHYNSYGLVARMGIYANPMQRNKRIFLFCTDVENSLVALRSKSTQYWKDQLPSWSSLLKTVTRGEIEVTIRTLKKFSATYVTVLESNFSRGQLRLIQY